MANTIVYSSITSVINVVCAEESYQGYLLNAEIAAQSLLQYKQR